MSAKGFVSVAHMEDLPTEPPASPAGARIIPPPEAATHLGSMRVIGTS